MVDFLQKSEKWKQGLLNFYFLDNEMAENTSNPEKSMPNTNCTYCIHMLSSYKCLTNSWLCEQFPTQMWLNKEFIPQFVTRLGHRKFPLHFWQPLDQVWKIPKWAIFGSKCQSNPSRLDGKKNRCTRVEFV